MKKWGPYKNSTLKTKKYFIMNNLIYNSKLLQQSEPVQLHQHFLNSMETYLHSPKVRFFELKKAETLSLLETCSNMAELKQIHAQMFKTGLVCDVIPTSKLITFSISTNSGNLAYARKVFDGFHGPNTFMWNTMIKGYTNYDKLEEALLLYHQMISQSVPHNNYTFPYVLKACVSSSAFEETRQIHARIIKTGFYSELYASNSLLHVYTTIGSIEEAETLFERIPIRDTVSSNSMINGYAKCGEMTKADELFRRTPEKNVVSWTIMISGFVKAGFDKEALELFLEMQRAGLEADKVTLTSVLTACAHLGALEHGIWAHSYIKMKEIHVDLILGCALINMYNKCGNLKQAIEVFKEMKRKDVSTWTVMIEGLAIHGKGREALEWFEKMKIEGINPNHVTFTAILTACSYSGLVNEGKSIFQSIEAVHQLNPSIEHYGCMVDLLGRAGFLEEAKRLIDTMPFKPNPAILGSMLNSCKNHRDFELGLRIGKTLIELDPSHGGRYIHLANIHASAEEWDETVKVRNEMRNSGISKLPGCSLISLNGTAHEFFAGDRSHPQIVNIYRYWELVSKKLREEGYKPETGNLLLDLEETEKETAVQQHSEKLAITFGLMISKAGVTIRVFNNLRVCEDCHNAAKLISKIFGREIVLRDRVRFHIFKEGKCSCEDYW